MNRYLNLLKDYLSGKEYSDFANAGKTPKNYDAGLHRAVAVMRASLVNARKDCIFTDTSRWQLDIQYAKTVSAGAKGTILKLGQGRRIDPYFKKNWELAKIAGLKRGSYWYYDSTVPPKEQAKLWADTLKEVGYGELPHFADYEENYGGDYAGIVHFADFFFEFKRLTGLPNDKLGIYTGYFYWLTNGTREPFWSDYWLWLAWYGHEADVVIPHPWTQEKLFGWQYTSSGDGRLFGVSSLEIDLNFFVKGLDIFEALFGETVDPEPEEQELGMYKVWSDSYNVTLRSAPLVGTTNGLVVVPKGTVALADALVPGAAGLAGDKWAHVTKVTVNGQDYSGYMAITHNGQTYSRYELLPESGANPVAKVTLTDETGRVFEGTAELLPK